MLQRSTLKFLKDLRQHNEKPWFDDNKTHYQQAKEDFESLTRQLIDGLARIDPAMESLQVKDCVFRIYKDVRFSKDKTPYKTNMGAYFAKGGKKSPYAGYYFQLEPGGNSFVAGGLWMPEAPVLKKVRQEIDYNFEEFQGIVGQKDFIRVFGKVNGDSLKSAPQGYHEDNPAIAYIKLKSLVVNSGFTDEETIQPTLVREILKKFAVMQPFINFLNHAQDE
ncbi:DUF2461 domain-containing protein [Chitinophaga sp. GCM10012297]|uniref:DUF2461 domain-containing protein n=1 Tax=Chitinophaga chungangae TaxID=2821488 RepID=A0ABS3YEJ7_9BACT|nr:DUF2461 domain-containing protein [Chitinophaga chungangae]MBO9153107.1 DUF2461 domain-containing protein [Chitinophaga chungangae]